MTAHSHLPHSESDVAGVDGCRAGWVVATADDAVVVPRLDLGDHSVIGIDIPIGLDDADRRACDGAARAFLGSARHSVFPAPPRAALACVTYEAAAATTRAVSGRGLSVQTYHLIAKIAEVDRLVDATHGQRVVEVHPECSFVVLNGGDRLVSKKTPDGQSVRRRLLSQHFDVPLRPPAGARMDDLLDAYAVLWSAQRFQRGEHILFGDGSRDARGLEMRIVC